MYFTLVLCWLQESFSTGVDRRGRSACWEEAYRYSATRELDTTDRRCGRNVGLLGRSLCHCKQSRWRHEAASHRPLEGSSVRQRPSPSLPHTLQLVRGSKTHRTPPLALWWTSSKNLFLSIRIIREEFIITFFWSTNSGHSFSNQKWPPNNIDIAQTSSGWYGKEDSIMADSEQSEVSFSSPEEERDYWKSKAIEYRTKWVIKQQTHVRVILSMVARRSLSLSQQLRRSSRWVWRLPGE